MQMGQCAVPMYIFLQFVWAKPWHRGDHCYLGWHFCFSGCWCRGNWPICLASNKFVEADSVLGQGVSSLIGRWGIGYSFKWWRVGVVNWKDFPQPGVFLLGKGTSSNFSFAKLYTITGMDVAADFNHGHLGGGSGYCGVGTVGVKFTGVVGTGSGRYGLGNYPHFIPSFGKHSGSSLLLFIHLGSWGFSGYGVVTLGRSTGAWLQLGLGLGLGLGPSLPSNSR